jgi:hypothetical protein
MSCRPLKVKLYDGSGASGGVKRGIPATGGAPRRAVPALAASAGADRT